MEAKEILKEISKIKSVYGYGAKLYMSDPIKGTQFLEEIFVEINKDRQNFEKAFGPVLVSQIIEFCYNNNKSK